MWKNSKISNRLLEVYMGVQEELAVAKKKVEELEKILEQLIKEKKQYDSVLNNTKEVIFQTNAEGVWTYLNRTWTEITGFSLKESLGVSFLNFVHPEDKELNLQLFIPLIEREKEYCNHVVRYITKDGGFKWIEIFARLTLDEKDNIIGISGTLNDVTERILMEIELKKHKDHLEELVVERTIELNESNERLSYLVTHDQLTNVPNRYSLEKALQESINNAKDKNLPSALLYIDLDNFKVINDTYAHSVGDEVLIKISELIKVYLDNKKVLARLGGDEFGLLLNETTIENAINTAEMIRTWLEKIDMKLPSGIIVNVTASIGVVKIDASLTPQEILAYADAALYSAKDNGKNRVEVVESSEDKKRLSESNSMVNLIKRAIKENYFVLYYQPIVKVGGKVLHYEALVRMLDEEGKLIPPNQFIPVAERVGLMSQIDKWVVKDVLRTLEMNQHISVFINLSGISLGDRAFLTYIEESIKNSRIEPAQLGFEITETSVIKELSQSERWIKRIKQLGCKFALDDFGVGFSSFSYLNSLPVDYLKIDGSFVKTLDKDPTQKALVQAMNAVAHALGKQTIAEFVENKNILIILQELNVDCGQGYYIGKPKPLK